jgi:SAM-dependent methyltransferase
MENSPENLISPETKRVARRLSSISAGRVLDVATGDGTFIQMLMKNLKDYESFTGIDISEEDVESTKERLKEEPVEILVMDGESLEFKEEHFDTVGVSFSLHHLINPDTVLAEMKRVLKRGGNFIVTEPYYDGNQTEAQRTGIASHHWHGEIDTLKGTPTRNTFTKREIKDTFGSLELTETEVFNPPQSINCLYCEKWPECSDTTNEEVKEKSIKGIERGLGYLKECEDSGRRSRLMKESEELKERIRRTGTYPASSLFLIGRK